MNRRLVDNQLSNRKILLYAHRGACRLHPENSMEAFAQALDDGANALELDVHRTADGHFIVFHDCDGKRLAGQPSAIRRSQLSEIKKWRLAGTNASVATLDDFLGTFTGVPMSIDLKPNDPSIVAPFLDLLKNRGAEAWVTIASFHHRNLTRVRAAGWSGRTTLSRIEVGFLKFAPEAVARRFVGGQSAQIPQAAGPFRLDRKHFLERCRRLGVRTDFWVVNEPDQARDLLARGATGLMTDDPARIAPAIRDLL